MSDAQRKDIEDIIRLEFDDYIKSADNDPYAFGMAASILYSKLCKIPFSDMGDKMKTVSFGKDDRVDIYRHPEDKDIFEFIMNRKYNNGSSLLASGIVSKVMSGDKVYDLYISASEIARNNKEGSSKSSDDISVYDVNITIKGGSLKDDIVVEETFAIENRHEALGFTGRAYQDLKALLSKWLPCKENVDKTIGYDEKRSGYYAANRKRDSIDGNNFRLDRTPAGFIVSCKGCNHDMPFEYFNSYRGNLGRGHTDALVFELQDEEVVSRILNHDDKTQDKLDAAMIILDNKRKLEEEYHFDKVTF